MNQVIQVYLYTRTNSQLYTLMIVCLGKHTENWKSQFKWPFYTYTWSRGLPDPNVGSTTLKGQKLLTGVVSPISSHRSSLRLDLWLKIGEATPVNSFWPHGVADPTLGSGRSLDQVLCFWKGVYSKRPNKILSSALKSCILTETRLIDDKADRNPSNSRSISHWLLR